MNEKQMVQKKTQQDLKIFFAAVFCILAVVLWYGISNAAQAKFSWLPNGESDLAGYKIYCKSKSDAEYPTTGIDVGKPATNSDGRVVSDYITVPDAPAACVATAYDSEGNESDFSVPAEFNIRPDAPKDFKVDVQVNVHISQ